MIRSLAALCVGASLGTILRWGLGLTLNTLFPAIPPGTWLANMLGGYLMGVALAFFGDHAGFSPEWRLLVITGFLGGLTTFSTFSAEVVSLIKEGRMLWACVAIAAHVGGSLLMTMLGLASTAIASKF